MTVNKMLIKVIISLWYAPDREMNLYFYQHAVKGLMNFAIYEDYHKKQSSRGAL